MKYIQVYQNIQISDSGLQIQTINGKEIFLTYEETLIYNCFSTATTINDVFIKLYGDTNENTSSIEYFNSLLVDWIQSSILKPI